jgi:hypothetical protein
MTSQTGTLKWFDKGRGYSFITPFALPPAVHDAGGLVILNGSTNMHALNHAASRTEPTEELALSKRSGLDAAYCDALSRELPAAVDSLWRRRAWEVPEGHFEDYVALGWMKWCSGAMMLTPAGRALHDMVVAQGGKP